MTTVYSVNNEIFAAKDLIFGWSFLGEKLGMEQYVPVNMLDKERVKVLQELYAGPLYPEGLKQALANQLVFLKKQEELSQLVRADTEPDELLTVLVRADMGAMEKDFEESPLKPRVSSDVGARGTVCEVYPDKPKVKMRDFKIPGRTYPLVNWCAHGDDMWTLMQRFGSSWSKVPDRKDIRYIRDKTKNIQFLMRLDDHGDPIQYELYQGMSFEEFKEAVTSNAIENKVKLVYTITDRETKSGGLVINALMYNNLW